MVAACTAAPDDRPDGPDPSSQRTPSAASAGNGTTDAAQGTIKGGGDDGETGVIEPQGEAPTLNGADPEAGAPLGSSPFLAVGTAHEGRLRAFRLGDLVSAAAGNDSQVTVFGNSAPVGNPADMTALPDGRIAVAATNHREIVLLSSDWTETETIALGPALQPSNMVFYGQIILDANRLLISHADDDGLGLSTVNLSNGTVNTRTWEDAWGSFPGMCQLDASTVAITGTEHVLIINLDTLERQHSVEPGERVLGAACVDGTVWVASADRPALLGVGLDGFRAGELTWQGTGGSSGLVVDDGGELWVSDPVERVVVMCDPAAGNCVNTPPLPSPPRSLLVLDHHVIATTHAEHLHIIARKGVDVVGTVAVAEPMDIVSGLLLLPDPVP